MREVSDAFLLNMAEVTAALVGLFLVGAFFFVEAGFHREVGARDPYFRSGTRIVLIVFAIPLLLSMTLVVMEPVWSQILFALLSVLLIAANVDSLRLVWGVRETSLTLTSWPAPRPSPSSSPSRGSSVGSTRAGRT